jgi:2,3-diaminopropionate biosynthesis protein SbnA
MAKFCEGVLEAIGSTPLVHLSKAVPANGPRCFVKLESMNPGGSAKDRAACEMISEVERTHGLKPGARIIVATSGNMGIGMAMACAYKGFRLICLVDPKISKSNEASLKLYGARIVKVWKRDHTGGYHLTRLEKVKHIQAKHPDAIYIDQYDSKANVRAHYSSTAPEIARALDGEVAAVICAAGTGGTAMGIARYFREHYPATKIWLVDEYGSLALAGNPGAKMRFLNGMGTSIPPANYTGFQDVIDRIDYIKAVDAVVASLDLARKEGILTGGSGGAVMHIMTRIACETFKPGQNVVGILPDHGSRYVETLYDNEWLALREIAVQINPDDDDDEGAR